jgi:uncharacterized membrane protein YcaP (DUF421 family)
MTLPDLGSSLPDVAIRTAVVYAFLVVALRLAGKRQVGQLSILDLVLLLVISDAVQNSMVGENTSLAGGILAALTLLLLDRALGVVAERNRRVRRAIEGEPRLLVRNGNALSKALHDEGVDEGELNAALREHGVTRVDQVRLAVLETDGSISVIPFPDEEARPPGQDTSKASPTRHRPAAPG